MITCPLRSSMSPPPCPRTSSRSHGVVARRVARALPSSSSFSSSYHSIAVISGELIFAASETARGRG